MLLKVYIISHITSGIEKKLNEKTGLYETVKVDIPKLTVA